MHVERAKRLVHQQEIRLHDPGLCHGGALSHPAAQLVRIAIAESFQTDAVDPRHRLGARLGRAPASNVEAQANVVDDRLPRQQRVLLEHVRGASIDAAQRLAEDRHRPARRRDQSGNQVENRRLAAAARPDHRHESAGRYIEADAFDGDVARKPPADVSQRDGRWTGRER